MPCAGWKEMDAYMRENKLEGAPSVIDRNEKPEKKSTPASGARDPG